MTWIFEGRFLMLSAVLMTVIVVVSVGLRTELVARLRRRLLLLFLLLLLLVTTHLLLEEGIEMIKMRLKNDAERSASAVSGGGGSSSGGSRKKRKR